MPAPFRTPGLAQFARDYANWDGLSCICVTVDQDWAPDYMLGHLLGLVEQAGVRITIYATHDSPLLRRVAAAGRHEVGLHPNLSPATTQGSGLADIVDRLRQAYPQARGNRFHVLGNSYRDLEVLGRRGIAYDCSHLMQNTPYCLPAWHPDLGMTLFTYQWEDGIRENAGLPPADACIDLDTPGLKIVNFHPLNVYLNCPDADHRRAFQRDVPVLLDCPEAVASRYRHTGLGSGTLLTHVLAKAAPVRTPPLSEVADAFRRQAEGLP